MKRIKLEAGKRYTNRNLYDVIKGVARLQGYSSATVSNIRYANGSKEA